jgi:hypothetical protein
MVVLMWFYSTVDAEGGRRGKRKRTDTSPKLMFELSDMSSEEDEQHPVMLRAKADPTNKPNGDKPNGDIMVINLASDSE